MKWNGVLKDAAGSPPLCLALPAPYPARKTGKSQLGAQALLLLLVSYCCAVSASAVTAGTGMLRVKLPTAAAVPVAGADTELCPVAAAHADGALV